MEENANHDISYYLAIPKRIEENLASIRKWNSLNVAIEEDLIWVSGFTLAQIESVEVKQLPEKTMYYSKKAKLYKLQSLLPEKKEPSLLWTPIERAFPISISDYNFNYFGLNQKISISLVPDEIEQRTSMMIVSIKDLENYLKSSHSFRTKPLSWVVSNDKEVLIFGTPQLPMNGITFWKNFDCFLPTGYNYELSIMAREINKKLNPEKENWIVWNVDNTYFKIDKKSLMPLSLGSFRKTFLTNNNKLNSDQ